MTRNAIWTFDLRCYICTSAHFWFKVVLDKVNELEGLVEKLISRNAQLKSQVVEGQKSLTESHEEIEKQKKQISALEEEVQFFQLAKGGKHGGEQDNSGAKEKINELIKEVDKCIALLNQ